MIEDGIRSGSFIGLSLQKQHVFFLVTKHLYVWLLVPLVKLEGQLQELGCYVMLGKIWFLKGCQELFRGLFIYLFIFSSQFCA